MAIVTTPSISSGRSHARRYERAARIVEAAVDDPELCDWCFERIRHYHPDEAVREAQELRWGATKSTLEAKGHYIGEDGDTYVNRTTVSDPAPTTERDYPPATRIDGEFIRSTATSICSCGVVDEPVDQDRSLSVIHTCIDNIAEWYAGADFSRLPDSLDAEGAHDRATQLRQYDQLSCQDEAVLTEAVKAGLWS